LLSLLRELISARLHAGVFNEVFVTGVGGLLLQLSFATLPIFYAPKMLSKPLLTMADMTDALSNMRLYMKCVILSGLIRSHLWLLFVIQVSEQSERAL